MTPPLLEPRLTRAASRESVKPVDHVSLDALPQKRPRRKGKFGRHPKELTEYVEASNRQIEKWQAELNCIPKGVSAEDQQKRDKIRNKISALRSRMNRKKEANAAETKIGGFEGQFI